MNVIQVQGYRKTFKGSLGRPPQVAVQDISFSVEGGQVFGFLGPNGAGKTTTIKGLLGLLRPDAGELRILGKTPGEAGWRERIGYLPEHPSFYPYLTGTETVVMFGRLAGLTASAAAAAADRLLDRVGLSHAKDRKLAKYSKGMLQRVGLAQALVADPELLILDEPLTGLDPVGRKELRDLFRELADEGKTVFYSTHILSDAESTCREVCIVSQGQVRYQGRLAGLGATQSQRYMLVLDAGATTAAGRDLAQQVVALPGHEGRVRLDFADFASAQAGLKAALEAGQPVIQYEPIQESLETFFMRMVEEERRA